jgi:hypothetical protein
MIGMFHKFSEFFGISQKFPKVPIFFLPDIQEDLFLIIMKVR